MRATIIVLVALFAVGVALMVYACCAINPTEAPPPTSPPYYTPEPTVVHRTESWARYDVPLDDDFQRFVAGVCRKYAVDVALVYAIIKHESDFDAEQVTDGADYGLMQVRATEHADRCERLGCWNLLDPYQNIRVGVDYLAALISHYDGDVDKALGFYNGDETGTYAALIQREADRLRESVQIASE